MWSLFSKQSIYLMIRLIHLPILLLFSSFIACDWCVDDEKICFEFDQRQCSGDVWAELVPINDEEEEREEKMKLYLESLGFTVFEVDLVVGYHTAVCEACNICPEEDRFFVQIDINEQSAFEELDYLNSAVIDCRDAF